MARGARGRLAYCPISSRLACFPQAGPGASDGFRGSDQEGGPRGVIRRLRLEGSTVGVLQFAGSDAHAEKFRVVRCDSFGIVDQGEGTDTDEESGKIEGETYDDAGRRVKWTEAISFSGDRRRLVTRTLFDAQGQPRVRLDMDLSKN